MSFSGTAVEQREQELKTIKTFLVYSLLGSLALHIGLLVSGVGNLLFKVPEFAEEPLEVTLVETPSEPEPIQQVEPPKPEIPEKSQILTTSDRSSGGGGGGGASIKSSAAVSQIPAPSPQNPPVATQPSNVVEKPPSQIEPVKPLPSQRTSAPQPQAKAPEPQNILTQTSPTNSTTIQANPQASANVGKLLVGMRNNRVNQGVSQPSQGTANSINGGVTSNSTGISGNGVGGGGVGSGNGTGNGSGSGTGNGSGSGTGNGSGSGNGNGSGSGSQVATAPTRPKLRFNSDNLEGRAACRQCNSSYPEWARKIRLEGRVKVAVDTDAQGNVINVRLVSSSGNGRLDAENLAQARKWKLKESAAGRRGVTIATEYVIRNSERSRQVEQAQKQRQEQQRNADSNSATNSATQVTNRRRRSLTVTNENIPTPSATESTSLSTENTSSPPTNKRRRRRENNSDPSVTNNGDTAQPTRRPRILEQPTSSDQTPQQVPSPESSAN